MDNMSLLFTWRQLETRAKELSSTLDLLLADQELAASIDKNRIGLLGFGTGGTAALRWAGPCLTAPPGRNTAQKPDAGICIATAGPGTE